MSKKSFERLKNIIDTLVGPNGCPWDKKQTHQSLRPYLIEEAYEVLEAIRSKKPELLAEELGDLLLQIMLHSALAAKEKKFTIDDVITAIADKMVRRHPHVFGKKSAKSVNQVWKSWEKIKAQENKNTVRSILDKVPRALPALYRANLVQKRAARVGFDWDRVAGAWSKVREEMEEVHELLVKRPKLTQNLRKKLEEEIGDLFFAVVNVARKLDFDPEETLHLAVEKFSRRFRSIEAALKKNPKMTIVEMDRIWAQVKKAER
jgi:tetrapyrrole methylase family protein/MazG family protein